MKYFYNFEINDFNKISKSETINKIATIKSQDFNLDTKFDIFLSHSYYDAKINEGLFLQIIEYFENKKFNVYVDWIDDSEINRDEVTEKTANIIKNRIINSRCLIYLTSQNSDNSKWMPWELGFKDGLDGKVCIMPLVENRKTRFEGQAYLGLYPEIGFLQPILLPSEVMSNFKLLFIATKSKKLLNFDTWLNE